MTSSPPPLPDDKAIATYRAEAKPKDTTAQATESTSTQWVLMKDVDPSSGYQTPPPPEQAPEYEGQVVVVPAVVERA
jgi:hypothetical protein